MVSDIDPLLPCQFCGSRNVAIVHSSIDSSVRCMDCHACGPIVMDVFNDSTKPTWLATCIETAKKWNTRKG